MSILLKSAILAEMGKGNIVIEPFHPEQLSTNSYDLHLGKNMFLLSYDETVDPKKDNSYLYQPFVIDEWVLLQPNRLYLGVTVEYTEAHNLIPIMEGKSSMARMGLSSHWCAGMGDAGFCGHWTLEIVVTNPTIVYPGTPIGQLIWQTTAEVGAVMDSYRETGSYNGAKSDDPWPMLPNLYKKTHQFIKV